MKPTPFRRDLPPDPLRQSLAEVRRGLLRLHKALIDSERAVFERGGGALTAGRFLQALLQEPFFAWLRPFSGLIVEIDEALATREPIPPERVRDYVVQVRALVAPPEEGGSADERYESVCRRDPGVLQAHLELAGRIADALAALSKGPVRR